MISYAFIDGFTRVPREDAIERLKRAIADADGVIVDFAFFGREAIRLTVELDAGSLVILGHELEAAGVELFPRTSAELAHAKSMSPSHPIVAMLHVHFLRAEAELGAARSVS